MNEMCLKAVCDRHLEIASLRGVCVCWQEPLQFHVCTVLVCTALCCTVLYRTPFAAAQERRRRELFMKREEEETFKLQPVGRCCLNRGLAGEARWCFKDKWRALVGV